jgi:hypothetical protein
VTFAFTIRNQLVCAIATCQAAVDERQNLLKFQREFFASSIAEANKSTTKGYVVGEGADASRLRKFAQTLQHHKIEAYQLTDNLTLDGKTFEKGKALYIPAAQPQYRMVRSMFDRPVKFADSLFYDASAWNMPLAFGLSHAEVKAAPTRGARVGEDMMTPPAATFGRSDYAYLIDYADFMANKALYQLLQKNILVKTALRPFKIADKAFGRGALVVPVVGQKLSKDELYDALKTAAQTSGVNVIAAPTGFSQSGIDLGSNNFVKVQKPEALMVVGNGVASYEAGEVWYWLDTHAGMPLSKVDIGALPRLNLSKYNVIIMVSGQYDRTLAPKIKQWIANGGTLITLKTATEWAIRSEVVREKLRVLPRADSMAVAKKQRISYEEAAANEGSKATGGAMFEADLDITNPIGYGYSDRKITLYRNNNTLLEPSNSAYNTVVQYTPAPHVAGYVHPQTLKKIAGSAGVLVSPEGSGRAVLFADNPNFRGIWYGTHRMFLNAIFFGSLITPPNPFGQND